MIVIALGTRPEVIKIFPVYKALKEEGLEVKVLFTGQHYDRLMCDVFFDYFGYKPDFNLNLKSSLVREIERSTREKLKELSPDMVVVLGDTNSTLAVAKATKSLNIPLAHIEAGLRSYDYRMPEENNRRDIDKISDFLFAPTAFAANNLKREGIKGRIYNVGNPIVDAVEYVKPTLDGKRIEGLGKDESYALFTSHREENLVVYERLSNIMRMVEMAASHMKVVLPVHPKLKLRMEQFRLTIRHENIILTDPLPYFDLLSLLKGAKIVITDSGGLQEEARCFNKPAITLRDTTERQETLLEGTNVLVGNHPVMFGFYLRLFVNNEWPKPKAFSPSNPFGDGKAGKRIAEIIKEIMKEKNMINDVVGE